jgi:hypothetical protein
LNLTEIKNSYCPFRNGTCVFECQLFIREGTNVSCSVAYAANVAKGQQDVLDKLDEVKRLLHPDE